MRQQMTDRWPDRFASSDPRMALWLVLIVAAAASPAAGYAALGFGAAYVLLPGAVRLARGDARGSTLGIASRAALAAVALAAAALGVVTHRGPTWWWTVAGLAATAAMQQLAARHRA